LLLLRSIVRPDRKEAVLSELSQAGFHAATVVDVVGRGKQKGIRIGSMVYDEIPKTLIITAIEDDDKDKAIGVIIRAARTGEKGAFGDGKIFVSQVEEAYTISSGLRGL
jgi:nitrogen regulatory protein PII 1